MGGSGHPGPFSGPASYSQADGQASSLGRRPMSHLGVAASPRPPAGQASPHAPGPSQRPPQTCTVEVILAVGEVLQERDALCLMVVASGCLQQHDLEETRYKVPQLPLSQLCPRPTACLPSARPDVLSFPSSTHCPIQGHWPHVTEVQAGVLTLHT